MSEPKERGDVQQALNELEQATELGNAEAVKAAHKRLDALGVSVKRRSAVLRKLASEESEEESQKESPKVDPKTVAPVERKAPGPTLKG